MDNIYALIARLRKARRQHALTSGAQALFYELIAISNEERWPKTFKCPAGELCSAIGCSEKTLGGYQEQLVGAGLIAYRSGKHKREPSEYSFYGGSLGSNNGVRNGGNNYHHSEHQNVSKTPDLLIHKRKSKTNTIEEEEVEVSARAAEIEEAVNEFCSPVTPDEEKEKNVAPKKETVRQDHSDNDLISASKRVLPAFCEALVAISETANWRNVLEAKIIPVELKPKWGDMDGIAREPYLQERTDLFEEFYAYKEDNYLAGGLPTWPKMAENFYHWVEIQKNKGLLKRLNGYANGTITKPTNGYTQHSAAADRHARNKGIADIVAGSEGFLQQYTDIRPESGFPE